jgi:hypothetical protein
MPSTFTGYETGPDGLVRFRRADGSVTPGLLPGATVMERQRLDMMQPMVPEVVPDGIVSAKSAPMTMVRASGDQGASGNAQPPPEEPPPADPAGAGGAPQSPPPGQPGAGGGGGAGGAPGGASPAPAAAGSPGAGIVKVAGESTTDADRDRATAAAIERERGRRALQGSPGVYDPGGERLVGYTSQRQGFSSTAPLREEERSGMPPEVYRASRDQLEAIPGRIEQLQLLAKRDPKNAKVYKEKADGLGREYARLQRVLGPSRDGEPGDAAALRDLEARERRLGFVDNDLAYVDKRAAEENAETLQVVAEQKARDAAERKAFEDRRQAKLSNIFSQIDNKRQDYERADVNPSRMFENATTGQTIAAALFTAAGALGNAISGDRGPNQALEIMQAAVNQDIQLQLKDIDKKGKELGYLAETYQLAKEELGSEEAGMLAAQLAAGDVLRAKFERTAAEATTERARLAALRLVEANNVAQGQRRLALEQASVGTRADQVRVDQPGYRGGSGPNYKAAAEAFKNAADLGGDKNAAQQVVLGPAGEGQRYSLGKFVEAGEGKQTRDTMNILNNALTEARDLKKMSMVEKTLDPTQKAVFLSRKKRLAENMSKIQGMGVLQKWDDEAAEKIYGSLMAGDNVMDDAERFLTRMGRGYLDQMGAKPTGATGAAAPWPVAGVPQRRPGSR